jgi:hypothetical protein
MGKKPEAGRDLRGDGGARAHAKGSRKKTAGREKTQSERFIETARAVGVDETGKEFERALLKIAPPKR